jgi:hypothetical protein
MQAQAWSYGVSWYSDIFWEAGAQGNKLGLNKGAGVVSEIYAFNYSTVCMATNSGNLELRSGVGNSGAGLVSFAPLLSDSDAKGKDKGFFYATGIQSLEQNFRHYKLGLTCYSDEYVDANNEWKLPEGGGIPTGNCSDTEINPDHEYHWCHAAAEQKVEYKDLWWMPVIYVYVQIVKLDDEGNPTTEKKAHGIAKCVYEGSLDMGNEMLTHVPDPNDPSVVTPCEVTEYPLSVEDPRLVHPLEY